MEVQAIEAVVERANDRSAEPSLMLHLHAGTVKLMLASGQVIMKAGLVGALHARSRLCKFREAP